MKSIPISLLSVAVTICFLVAGTHLYEFYQNHRPVAQVGECLEIEDSEFGPLKLKITNNDNWSAVSDAIVDTSISPEFKIQVPVQVSYEELRYLNAKKVNCE